MSLSEARFHDLVDTLQQTIEDAFDDTDLDVDLENSGGVLTVRFENGSQLIFSRQAPLRQLWLAGFLACAAACIFRCKTARLMSGILYADCPFRR